MDLCYYLDFVMNCESPMMICMKYLQKERKHLFYKFLVIMFIFIDAQNQ